MLFNRALRDAALPMPPETVMHDWWMMLVAVTTGSIAYLDQATLLYRQHGSNQMGANGTVGRAVQLLRTGAAPYLRRQRLARRQAEELLRRFAAVLPEPERETCRVFAELGRLPPPLRQLRAFRQGLRKWGWLRNLAFFALM